MNGEEEGRMEGKQRAGGRGLAPRS